MYLKKIKFKGDFIMKSEKLILRFEGENDIDLDTLSNSLNSTVETLKELADVLINENDFCKFKVLNIEKGSFKVIINQIIEVAPSILPLMPTVITAFKEILEIRKFLNGDPPKEVIKNETNVKIENMSGNYYSIENATFNVYTHRQNIEKEMANIAKSVLLDKDRTGLTYEIIDDNGKIDSVKMDKNILANLSVPQDVEKFDSDIQENEMTTYVKVRKPDLKGKSKWGLTLNGKSIMSDISDSDFLEKVHKNEISFNSNTMLYVKMIIRFRTSRTTFSENSSEILSRTIIKVLDVKNDY